MSLNPKAIRDTANGPWEEEPVPVVIDETVTLTEDNWRAVVNALAVYESKLAAKASAFRERLLNGDWSVDTNGGNE